MPSQQRHEVKSDVKDMRHSSIPMLEQKTAASDGDATIYCNRSPFSSEGM